MAKNTAVTPGKNPLSKSDYQNVLQRQRELHDLLPLIDSAEKCGLPCDEFREVHRFLTEKFNAIIREFFTPPPS